jgi:glycosyltransferase involved in cell wall biosynthesis
MKKILYVDVSLSGHRLKYLKVLGKINLNSVMALPEQSDEITNKQILYNKKYIENRSLLNYINWLKSINKIANTESVDCIHFLCGDFFYRYFGIGLRMFKKPIVITFHHMLFDFIRIVSLRKIFKKVSNGIVHTDELLDSLKAHKICNAIKIEYPCFIEKEPVDKSIARRYLGIPDNKVCISVLGGTHRYKGLDILLEALKAVNQPFTLYIAGQESYFHKTYISSKLEGHLSDTIFNLNRLSEEDYFYSVCASDIIILPYKYEFDGASGPMIDGVWCRKYIIGSSHGSMGNIIRKHHLGEVFRTEDANDLSKTLKDVLLEQKFQKRNSKSEIFRREISIDIFVNNHTSCYRLL